MQKRWIIIILLFAGLLGLNVLWFIPSPLLCVIMDDLKLSLTQAGLSMSIVCLMLFIFSIAGGWLLEKLGTKATFTTGLFLMAAGALCTLFVTSSGEFFLTRVIMGMGFGFCMPVSGVVIMEWFPKGEREYINTINASLPYIATIFIFTATIPLYQYLNQSWRAVVALLGGYLVLVFLGCLFFTNNTAKSATPVPSPEGQTSFSLFSSVWRNREMKLLSIAEVCDMWGFQFLTAMLPTYYVTSRGMSLTESANLMILFPIAGIIASLGCGIAMTKLGYRKPFTWPMHLIIFLGTLMAVAGDGWIRIAGIILAGFGNAGWAPALFTLPMEFEGMTPQKVGIAYSIMLSLGFLSAFISPWLGGFLSEKIGMFLTLILFSFASLIAMACTLMMKETGPGMKSSCRA